MNPSPLQVHGSIFLHLRDQNTSCEAILGLVGSFSTKASHLVQKILRPTLLNCRDRRSVQVQAQLLRFMELRCILAARH